MTPLEQACDFLGINIKAAAIGFGGRQIIAKDLKDRIGHLKWQIEQYQKRLAKAEAIAKAMEDET